MRDLVRRYPVASAAVAVALAVLIGYGVYSFTLGTSGRTAQEAAPKRATPAAPGKAQAPAPSGAPGKAEQPGAGGPSAPSAAAPAGGGRPDPFVPLVAATQPSRGQGGASLPPVPPLYPGGLPLPPGVSPGGAPRPGAQYRLVGVLNNSTALAIVQADNASYIVSPGDYLGVDTRVVRIDVFRRAVDLSSHGQTTELVLGGGKAQ